MSVVKFPYWRPWESPAAAKEISDAAIRFNRCVRFDGDRGFAVLEPRTVAPRWTGRVVPLMRVAK